MHCGKHVLDVGAADAEDMTNSFPKQPTDDVVGGEHHRGHCKPNAGASSGQ